MTSAICTLFEGDYHYGVGALANSLYAHGFRGTIYTGYRGPLPPWVGGKGKGDGKWKMGDRGRRAGGGGQKSISGLGAEVRPPISDLRSPLPAPNSDLPFSNSYLPSADGVTDYRPAEGLTLRFIPLTTKVHLTNYKPDFMLNVWERHCPQAEALFYFDPDITIKCRWTFFEEWVQGGVALCEDVNSPMPSTHPIRNAWRKYYGNVGRMLPNILDIYVNGGFVGVTRERKQFLETWQAIQQEMSPAAENLMGWGLRDRTFAFCFTDQDALNISLMNTALPFSLSGKDGMDISRFGFIMSHALGTGKPWRRRYLFERLFKGSAPWIADKRFWENLCQPIKVSNSVHRRLKILDLQAAAAIDRLF